MKFQIFGNQLLTPFVESHVIGASRIVYWFPKKKSSSWTDFCEAQLFHTFYTCMIHKHWSFICLVSAKIIGRNSRWDETIEYSVNSLFRGKKNKWIEQKFFSNVKYTLYSLTDPILCMQIIIFVWFYPHLMILYLLF